jgi:HEAT repeat protein
MANRLNVLLVVALAAGVGVAVWCLPTREPVYQGKRLSQWLEYLGPGGSFDTPERRLARQALDQAGDKAIPVLIKLLRVEDSLESRLMSYLQAQRVVKIKFKYISRWDRNCCGLSGFYYFGERASNAVPVLITMLEDTRPVTWQENAARALAYIGPGAKSAIPALLKTAVSTNSAVCCQSIIALGDVRPPAELVMPVLLKGLDRDTTIQFPAAGILSGYGQAAASAVPDLRELLRSQNQTTRFLAATCLKGLGVDVEAKANR